MWAADERRGGGGGRGGMSAVMSTLSLLGGGGGRARRKLHSTSSGRKSGQFSDAGEQCARRAHLQHQQRSTSLQTLENNGADVGVVNLENLEAKMASIEVSLAGSRRRAAGAGTSAGAGVGAGARDLEELRAALADRDTLIQSLQKQLSATLRAGAGAGAGAGCACACACGGAGGGALSGEERRALQERAVAVRADLDARRATLHELRRRLERTHVTDNIDSRIQQAELQYQAGREELQLQALREQARALHALLAAPASAPASATAPLYPVVRERGGAAWLVATEPRAGSWGAAPAAGAAGDAGGLQVDWASDGSGLKVGDRLVEVDGVCVLLCRSEEELAAAAAAGEEAARVLVLRGPPHPEPTATAAALRADNTRLTHRISYLEEQVSELLARHHKSTSSNDNYITVNKSKQNVTSISISSAAEAGGGGGGCGGGELQVFQKGPDVTALVTLPLRPRSNASGASSRASPASPAPPPRSHSAHALHHSLSHQGVRAACAHSAHSAETDAAIRMIERNQRHLDEQRRPRRRAAAADPDADADRQGALRDARSAGDLRLHHYEIQKAADRIQESIKKTNWAERKTLSIIEQLKRSQRLRKLKKSESAEDVQLESETHYTCRRIDGKVLENAHKSSRRTSKLHSRSAKSSEMESECSDFHNGECYVSPRMECDSEGGSGRLGRFRRHEERARADGDGRARPAPPRKPLRLSLHAAPAPAASAAPTKRAHGSGGGERREARDGARATPRPTRKLLPALSAPPCAPAPAADALYPDARAHPQAPRHVARARSHHCC